MRCTRHRTLNCTRVDCVNERNERKRKDLSALNSSSYDDTATTFITTYGSDNYDGGYSSDSGGSANCD